MTASEGMLSLLPTSVWLPVTVTEPILSPSARPSAVAESLVKVVPSYSLSALSAVMVISFRVTIRWPRYSFLIV